MTTQERQWSAPRPFMHQVKELTPAAILSQELKKAYVAGTERGDLPPVAIMERQDKVIAVVIAPQVDRDMGLHACRLGRAGMAADTVTFVTDAHTALNDEAAQKYMSMPRKGKVGSMQRACDEEGACQKGEISDCLMVMKARKGFFSHQVLTYDYHGEGDTLKWTPQHWYEMSTLDPDMKFGGVIPESLEFFFKEPTLLEIPDMVEMGKKMGLNEERMLYHGSRGTMQALEAQGYFVMDWLSGVKEYSIQEVAERFKVFSALHPIKRKK
jgi:hypothetical protein